MSQNTVSIKNKRARFDYELLETFEAGLVLGGTEIKSIRQSKARITESFCEFNERRRAAFDVCQERRAAHRNGC